MAEDREQQRKPPSRALEDDPLTLKPVTATKPSAAAREAPVGAGVVSRKRLAPPPAETAGTRVARAWQRHPVVAFLSHGKRVAFYRQLYSLVKAGVGMPTALADMARYAPDRRTKAALIAIAGDLANGSTLGDAFARHGSLFDDATVELLVFAEETGKLEPVLAQILDHMDKQQRLRWTAIFASLWPAYLFVGFTLFGPLFDIAGALSASKGAAVNYGAVYMSGLLRNLLTGVLAFGALLGGPLALAALGVDAAWDEFKMRIPGVGRVIRAGYASRFFLGLSLALSSGVEIMRAVRISLRASGSPALAGRSKVVESKIRSGASLADAIETIGVFDPPQVGTIAIGEKTGRLDESLAQLAKDAQDTAIRGTRLLVLAALFLVALIAIAVVLRPILGTIFGPIKSYYDLPNQIE